MESGEGIERSTLDLDNDPLSPPVESGEGIERTTRQNIHGDEIEWNPVKELKDTDIFVHESDLGFVESGEGIES